MNNFSEDPTTEVCLSQELQNSMKDGTYPKGLVAAWDSVRNNRNDLEGCFEQFRCGFLSGIEFVCGLTPKGSE